MYHRILFNIFDCYYNAQAVGQEEYNHNEIIQILSDAKVHQQVCSISPSATNVSKNSIQNLRNMQNLSYYSLSLEYVHTVRW